MRIVIAPDSFKGSLSALEAARAVAEGITIAMPQAELELKPIADGGEGFVHALLTASGGTLQSSIVRGPFGETVSAAWGVLGDGETAVIEMAAASGLMLVPESRRNPALTSTFGTGELIRHALDAGYRKIIIGIGGSATNDGGAGMAKALGARFLDDRGQELPCGGLALRDLATINISSLDPRLRECTITAACDVTNPLVGPRGASAVYGPQKGASPEMVDALDAALSNYAVRIEQQLGMRIAETPGAGAAGGLGAGLMVFAQAALTPGFDVVAEAVGLEAAIAAADLVFTGEGSVDGQSAEGKAVFGVTTLGAKHNKPVVVLGGSVLPGASDLYAHGMMAALSITPGPLSLAACMDDAYALLAKAAETAMRLILLGSRI